MPKKPNYDFEKRERERLKNAKKLARANEKAAAATDDEPAQDGPPADKSRQEA
jgi:hypothetical protein